MQIRFVVCFSAVILALACLPLATFAQQPVPSQPMPAVKISSSEVMLPVTVRDKKGALVASLKFSDLTLTEDSRPQVIKSFTREVNMPFRLGLLVDTRRSMMGAMDSERKAAGKLVDTLLAVMPNAGQNQAFLIHFDREVELLEDFTSSRDRLHHALDEMGSTSAAQDEARNAQSNGNNNGGWGQTPGHAQARGMRGGSQLFDAIYLASDELMKKQYGRKALVVFSDGVDRDSRMSLNDAVDAADRVGLAVYTIYLKSEQERPAIGLPGGDHRGGMNGSWHGSAGAGTGAAQPEEGPILRPKKPLVDGRKIMEMIATRTGGHFYEAKKMDSLEEICGQIAQELRGQYLLTYTPDMVDNEGGFHKITLKANKDDLTVITREGYYAPGREAK